MNLLTDLAVSSGLSVNDVLRVVSSAPKRYKQFEIPKRSGGWRTIAQPSRELKLLQRLLIKSLLHDLPVHSAAMAYVVGRNILENAQSHSGGSAVLKLDFKEFFPSIRVLDWVHYVRKNRPEWEQAGQLQIMSRLLFWGGGKPEPKFLSIGAPTSPLISNLIMFDLDTQFDLEARRQVLKYTRYADDLTISGDSSAALRGFEVFVRKTLRETKRPKLSLNEQKRGLFTKGQRRLVTGLVVTPTGTVSIGRERKKLISSLIHRFSLDELDAKRIGYLKGMLGFAIANEPEFVERMRVKYGEAVVTQILQLHLPKRDTSIDVWLETPIEF